MVAFNKDTSDILEKIEYGFQLAIDRLYEKAAANNETMVIYENGAVKHVLAKDILDRKNNNVQTK